MNRSPRRAIFEGARLPLLFAHRGYSTRAPENTLRAFGAAREAGIPGVELDVHRCATGELVVIHDHDLERLAGRPGTVEDEDFAALRELDVGSWFGRGFEGERIPLLAEVFDLLGDSVYYDIEIKSRRKKAGALEHDLVELLRARSLTGRCLISSFNPYSIRRVKAIDPELPTALLYSNAKEVPWPLRHGEGRLIAGCNILKPESTKIRPWALFFNRTLMRYPIVTWTVDSPDEAARLLRMNVAGIVSNDPGALLSLTEYRTLSREEPLETPADS